MTVKIVVRTTSTSESTGSKTRLIPPQEIESGFPESLPGYSEIELNVFDSVDSSIRRGPNSIFFLQIFSTIAFKIKFFHLTSRV